jgi:hypothetical protein
MACAASVLGALARATFRATEPGQPTAVEVDGGDTSSTHAGASDVGGKSSDDASAPVEVVAPDATATSLEAPHAAAAAASSDASAAAVEPPATDGEKPQGTAAAESEQTTKSCCAIL